MLFPGQWARLAAPVTAPGPARRLHGRRRAGPDGPGPVNAASVEAPSGVILARPVDDGEEDRHRTLQVLLRLIENTPAGERIRIVGNSFSYVPVAEALAQRARPRRRTSR